MTVLQIHEVKKLLYRVLKVCEEPYEPEVQFLYLKNSEADLRESFLSIRPEIPVHTSCFSSDSHSTCFWKSGKAIHAGHSHL